MKFEKSSGQKFSLRFSSLPIQLGGKPRDELKPESRRSITGCSASPAARAVGSRVSTRRVSWRVSRPTVPTTTKIAISPEYCPDASPPRTNRPAAATSKGRRSPPLANQASAMARLKAMTSPVAIADASVELPRLMSVRRSIPAGA